MKSMRMASWPKVAGYLSFFAFASFILAGGLARAVTNGTPMVFVAALMVSYLAVMFFFIRAQILDPDATSVSGDYPFDDPNVHPHFKDWERP